MATCGARASASEYTATVAIPIFRAVRITRQAIYPRLAIRIFVMFIPAPVPFPSRHTRSLGDQGHKHRICPGVPDPVPHGQSPLRRLDRQTGGSATMVAVLVELGGPRFNL